MEALEDKVLPAAPTIFKYLPALWDSCEDQNLLRTSILITLTFIVKALKSDSKQLHGFLVPVLSFCTSDPLTADRAYLVEQALELWHVMMQSAPVMTPELMSLFPSWLALQSSSLEHFEVSLSILESYVLLGRSELMNVHAANISQMVHSCAERVNESGLALMVGRPLTFSAQHPQSHDNTTELLHFKRAFM